MYVMVIITDTRNLNDGYLSLYNVTVGMITLQVLDRKL